MIIVRTDDAIYAGGEVFYLEKLHYSDEWHVVFMNAGAVKITKPAPLKKAKETLEWITDRLIEQQLLQNIVIDMRKCE